MTKTTTTKMASKSFYNNIKEFFNLLKQLLLTKIHHKKSRINNSYTNQSQYLSCDTNSVLVFHVEGVLLKSPSLFPYFMLVAFEGGSLLRALVLLLLYPVVFFLGRERGLKLMTFVCFFGIKKESFRVGNTVLPKFFLEDVGNEGFDLVMRFDRKIGASDLPRVMVEGFLRDYLGVEAIVGRELKVFHGYFVGLMEEKKQPSNLMNKILGKQKISESDFIGVGCFNRCLDYQLFSYCKIVHLVTETEKLTWKILPRKKYPKPLIFHDGRLAFRLTPLDSLAMFMWIPFGLILCFIRFSAAMLLPYRMQIPIMCFTGMTGELSNQNSPKKKKNNTLYVSNHRTLIDPLYVSILLGKSVPAVTYSLSKIVELLAPIKTVRLTRNREKDYEIIWKLLKQDDLMIFPEGTTCREPYLLRFSPLFAETSDEIVPTAIDLDVSMFYATTASGYKALDPLFLLMNPRTYGTVKILERLPATLTCKAGGKSSFEVANLLQAEIGKALGYECTSFTRKDKYMILAGNNGIV